MALFAMQPATVVTATISRISHVFVALVLPCAALVVVSPTASAQTNTVVEIASGSLDRDRVEGPRWERRDFDPLLSGTHTIRLTWDGDAELLFSVFELAGGTRIATPSDSVIPNEWTGTLNGSERYAISVWSSAGSADYTATIEAQTTALTIASQPFDVTVGEGADAVFSVTATGDGTLGYQWFASTTEPADGADDAVTVNPATEIPGATADTLNVSAVTMADSGTGFLVKITDGSGSMVASDIAILTVEAAPLEILAQPDDLSVIDGDDAVFSVTATGSGSLHYQWFADGTAIPGATDAILAISPVALTDSGNGYSVEITDDTGSSVTSGSATLLVDEAPVTVSIISQPADVTVTAGEDAIFSVTATGSGTLGYQWFVNDIAMVGATTDTLALSAVSTQLDGNLYRVDITDDTGTASSTDVILVVEQDAYPMTLVDFGQGLLDHDKDLGPRYVRLDFDSLGATVHTITVSWDSQADVRFKVLRADGADVSPVIRGSNPGVWVGELDADQAYYIGLWSSAGIANYTASLEASVPVSLTRQPVDLFATEGDDVTFSVDAVGSGDLTYQWFADGTPIFGETAEFLTVFNTSLDESGTGYAVEVSNGFDAIASDVATLTVNEPLLLGLYSEQADTTTWMLSGPAPTLDYQAGQNTGAWGRVLLRVGNLLLVGGDFQGIKPERSGPVTDRPFLAALDAVTGQPLSTFQVPPEVNTLVRALALSPSGDRIYVGGDFGLLALDASTGELDVAVSVSEGEQQGRVFDIAVTSLHVYIGGDFSNVDNAFRANIARLSLDGELDPSWSPNVTHGFEAGRSAPVQSVTVSPDERTVYVGGNFGFIDGTPVERTPRDKNISMLALEADDGSVRPERFIPDTGNNGKAAQVHDIAVTPFYVIVAWGGPNYLTFHSLAGDRLRQYSGRGDVQALQVVGNHVFVGHHGEYFGSVNDPFPPEAVESVDPRILVPYKFHSFRIDDGSFEREQAWQLSGIFGVWGIAAAKDSIWLAGQLFRAGSNERPIDGLVRFSADE